MYRLLTTLGRGFKERIGWKRLGIAASLVIIAFAITTLVRTLKGVDTGVMLVALYGPHSPVGAFLERHGIKVIFAQPGILLALLFVTLPFVVRAVQPVLLELDTEMEEAAASLGAGSLAIFRRIVFPNLLPAILSGVALAFARAVGEFGAVVLISGNLPFKTEVSSVYIFGRIESGDTPAAAAVAVVLLVLSFVLLLSIGVIRHFTTRHDRA